MGKKIDRFILTLILSAMLYYYFYRLFGNIPAALAAAMLACFTIIKLSRSILSRMQHSSFLQKRYLRRQTGGILMHLACMQEEDARIRITDLISKAYRSEHTVEIIQEPPSATLDQHQLFAVWKKHRDEEKLVICCTCKADQDTQYLAASLRGPQVALITGELIVRLAAEHPEFIDAGEVRHVRKKLHLRRIATHLFNRRNAPRSLLFAATLFLLYLLSGNAGYLIASILLFFIAFVSLHQHKMPAKLF